MTTICRPGHQKPCMVSAMKTALSQPSAAGSSRCGAVRNPGREHDSYRQWQEEPGRLLGTEPIAAVDQKADQSSRSPHRSGAKLMTPNSPESWKVSPPCICGPAAVPATVGQQPQRVPTARTAVATTAPSVGGGECPQSEREVGRERDVLDRQPSARRDRRQSPAMSRTSGDQQGAGGTRAATAASTC